MINEKDHNPPTTLQPTQPTLNMNEEKVLINDLKINYKIAGGGEPLLILHGWAGSSGSWIDVQRILAKEGFKVIVPDLPGFGKSHTPSVPWGIAEYSEFILNFLQKMGLKKVNLLGHSFGGRIAIKFASHYPERLKKLILCASAGIKHNLTFPQKIVLNLALIGNFLFSKKLLRRFKDVARNIFYMFLRKKDYTKVNGVMKETFKRVVEEDIRPELTNIGAKTLLIWGEKDKSVPLEDAYLMKENISHSILEIIPGASHTSNLESPQKLSSVISNFLKLRDPAS